MKESVVLVAIVLFVGMTRAGEEGRSQKHDSTNVESSLLTYAEKGADVGSDEEPEKQEEDLWRGSTLTGNANGSRKTLTDQGIDFSLNYKADNISNLSGGLARRSSYLHNIDFVIAIDCEKLMNWKGGRLLVQAMSNNGQNFSGYVGDAQIISNIEAQKMTKIYQALIQQDFMEGKLSFLGGLYDLNSEFYVTDQSAMFLNSSFGVGKELSQTGQNGPSIFPTPSLGVRIRLQPTDAITFQFAAFDAVPGSTTDPTAASLVMSKEEGAFVIGELSYNWQGFSQEHVGAGKFTVGAWFYTAEFEEAQSNAATGSALRSTANNGFYILAEQTLFAETETQGFAIFSRLGVANGNINPFDYNLAAGAVYTGLIPTRDDDKLGFAFTHANNSTQYKRAMLLSGSSVAAGELALELTYRTQMTPWLVVQPDFQYIFQPGGNPNVKNASVLGTRIEIGL